MQIILNKNLKSDTFVQGKYTLGFRFAVAKNDRKRIECQLRDEVMKPLSKRLGISSVVCLPQVG
jgi:hypothetical protein